MPPSTQPLAFKEYPAIMQLLKLVHSGCHSVPSFLQDGNSPAWGPSTYALCAGACPALKRVRPHAPLQASGPKIVRTCGSTKRGAIVRSKKKVSAGPGVCEGVAARDYRDCACWTSIKCKPLTQTEKGKMGAMIPIFSGRKVEQEIIFQKNESICKQNQQANMREAEPPNSRQVQPR